MFGNAHQCDNSPERGIWPTRVTSTSRGPSVSIEPAKIGAPWSSLDGYGLPVSDATSRLAAPLRTTPSAAARSPARSSILNPQVGAPLSAPPLLSGPTGPLQLGGQAPGQFHNPQRAARRNQPGARAIACRQCGGVRSLACDIQDLWRPRLVDPLDAVALAAKHFPSYAWCAYVRQTTTATVSPISRQGTL